MKNKLIILMSIVAIFSSSQIYSGARGVVFDQVRIKNQTQDKDIYIYAWGKTGKTACSKFVPGLTTKAKLPFFRLGKGEELNFDKKDKIKIRFYNKENLAKPEKYVIAANADSKQIIIRSATQKGVELEGGNAQKE